MPPENIVAALPFLLVIEIRNQQKRNRDTRCLHLENVLLLGLVTQIATFAQLFSSTASGETFFPWRLAFPEENVHYCRTFLFDSCVWVVTLNQRYFTHMEFL